MSYKLPSMSHTFHVNVQGKETKRIYEGQFTYLRPNLGTQCEIEKMEVRLNGDLKNISAGLSRFNSMCAHLFYTLTDSPDWWKESANGRNLYDVNVVEAIYEETAKFEKDWQTKVWGEDKEKIEVK